MQFGTLLHLRKAVGHSLLKEVQTHF